MDTSVHPSESLPRLTYSIDEAAAVTTLSRRMLYRLMEAGKLRTVCCGRRRLVPAAELERLFEIYRGAKSEYRPTSYFDDAEPASFSEASASLTRRRY
jgi:excisionase family DNA binding protein